MQSSLPLFFFFTLDSTTRTLSSIPDNLHMTRPSGLVCSFVLFAPNTRVSDKHAPHPIVIHSTAPHSRAVFHMPLCSQRWEGWGWKMSPVHKRVLSLPLLGYGYRVFTSRLSPLTLLPSHIVLARARVSSLPFFFLRFAVFVTFTPLLPLHTPACSQPCSGIPPLPITRLQKVCMGHPP